MDEPEEQVDDQPADDSGPDTDQVEPDLAEIEETWSDEPADFDTDTDTDTDVDAEPDADPAPDSEPADTDPAYEPEAEPADSEADAVDETEPDQSDSEADLVDESEAEPDEVPEQVPVAPAVEPTGHAGVDAVLGSLDGLEQRSVHEHVGVFEEAHAALRRALDETDQQG